MVGGWRFSCCWVAVCFADLCPFFCVAVNFSSAHRVDMSSFELLKVLGTGGESSSSAFGAVGGRVAGVAPSARRRRLYLIAQGDSATANIVCVCVPPLGPPPSRRECLHVVAGGGRETSTSYIPGVLRLRRRLQVRSDSWRSVTACCRPPTLPAARSPGRRRACLASSGIRAAHAARHMP